MRNIMERIRCMIRTILAGGEDSSDLDKAFHEAKERHDHAINDLAQTMEQLASEPRKSGND